MVGNSKLALGSPRGRVKSHKARVHDKDRDDQENTEISDVHYDANEVEIKLLEELRHLEEIEADLKTKLTEIKEQEHQEHSKEQVRTKTKTADVKIQDKGTDAGEPLRKIQTASSRLFGRLAMGTLKRAQEDWTSFERSDTKRRRNIVEERVEQKAEKPVYTQNDRHEQIIGLKEKQAQVARQREDKKAILAKNAILRMKNRYQKLIQQIRDGDAIPILMEDLKASEAIEEYFKQHVVLFVPHRHNLQTKRAHKTIALPCAEALEKNLGKLDEELAKIDKEIKERNLGAILNANAEEPKVSEDVVLPSESDEKKAHSGIPKKYTRLRWSTEEHHYRNRNDSDGEAFDADSDKVKSVRKEEYAENKVAEEDTANNLEEEDAGNMVGKEETENNDEKENMENRAIEQDNTETNREEEDNIETNREDAEDMVGLEKTENNGGKKNTENSGIDEDNKEINREVEDKIETSQREEEVPLVDHKETFGGQEENQPAIPLAEQKEGANCEHENKDSESGGENRDTTGAKSPNEDEQGPKKLEEEKEEKEDVKKDEKKSEEKTVRLDYSKMTVVQLRARLDHHGIAHKSVKLKKDLISLLMKET